MISPHVCAFSFYGFILLSSKAIFIHLSGFLTFIYIILNINIISLINSRNMYGFIFFSFGPFSLLLFSHGAFYIHLIHDYIDLFILT